MSTSQHWHLSPAAVGRSAATALQMAKVPLSMSSFESVKHHAPLLLLRYRKWPAPVKRGAPFAVSPAARVYLCMNMDQ